jgi:pyruvate ferredoxin oxidoreductase alpha subunit
MKKIEECSKAIAEAVRICKPEVIAAYPITPQTHIVERLADFINEGLLNSEVIYVESEHSAMSACIGASATGSRTFTATCSQGLALMNEMLFIASGLRLPIVMVNVNRALSAPISIWNDMQDSISVRDSGWIQLYVESTQEAYDTIFQAYKISESVNLPVMVCLDGFILSHLYEPYEQIKDIKKFLPKYKPKFKLDPKKPITIGPVATPKHYMEIRESLHKDLVNSKNIIKKINSQFYKIYKREYGDGLIEHLNPKAKTAFLAAGTVCGTIREFIKNKNLGLIKLKCFRPFPTEELQKITKNIKNLIVIDKDISLGQEGTFYSEVKDALYNSKIKIQSCIAGLGGRDITTTHLKNALRGKKWLN